MLTLAAASSKAFGVNPRRKALYFSPPTAGRYSVAFGEDAVLDKGITIYTATEGLWVTDDEIGVEMIQQVNVIAAGAASAGAVEAYDE